LTFRAKQWRILALAMAIGFAVDIIFAWLVVRSLSTYPPSASDVFVTFLLLQVAYVIIGVKNAAASWLSFLANRKAAAEQLTTILRDEGFAARPGSFYRPADYFAQIVDDDKEAIQLRLKAAAFAGVLAYPSSNNRIFEAMRLDMVYEDALSKL
jgi:hypothetical protein